MQSWTGFDVRIRKWKEKKKPSVLQPFKNTTKIIEWQSLGKTYKWFLFIFVLYPWPVPERAFISTHCVTLKKGSWIEQGFSTYVIASEHNGLNVMGRFEAGLCSASDGTVRDIGDLH